MKKILILVMTLVMMMSMTIGANAAAYTVKSGDVLWKIARDYDTSIDAIVDLNDIANRDLIYVDQVLEIPEMASTEEMTLTNAEKAVAVIESIGTSNTEPIGYINPDMYIQHNLGAKDGLAGFGELASMLPEGSYGKNIRVFEDGDYVIMHNEYNFFGPKVGFDVFRFEDGLIVEHWDNLSPIAEPNPSGRTQLDGTTEVMDLELTEANKALVEGFVSAFLLGNNDGSQQLTDYISPVTYLQHNSAVADGLDGFGAAMAALAEAGTPMVYTENHFIFGSGNFVLTVSEGQFLGEHVAFYDLFRIEEGLIVEHWDVIETIPAEDEWMNTNGKF